MKYRVEVTDHAFEAIQAAARYIASDRQAPLNAQRWLEGLWVAIDSLEAFPRAHALAEEDAYRPFEIRKLNHGDYLVLFTVNDRRQTVYVIAVRHGMQEARRKTLPEKPSG